MSPDFFAMWVPAFVSTILSEVPIYALFLRGRMGLGNALALGVALQMITHPLFWIAWDAEPMLFYAHYDLAVVVFELVIFLVEAAIVWAVLRRRRPWQHVPNVVLALLASLCANGVSLTIGLLSEH